MTEPLGSIAELREVLDAGEVSSVQLVGRALARAEALGTRLNAFLGLRSEGARADAARSDERRARGAVRSPLDGIPVAVKDNMVMQGEPTTCASRILEGFVSPYSSTLVEKLEAAGAVVVGRTNMDEFAMGSSTEHSVAGPSHNPWDPARAAGGSSGGSAAAVAAGIVPAAFGSDTGGSIRQPASFCGVVGMKPTYGRVSRWGLVAFASSLDQIGAFARSAAEVALLLEAVSGHDPRDSTSAPEPVPSWGQALDGDVSGLTLGLPREYSAHDGIDPAVLACVRDAVAELERAGAKVCEVSLPHAHTAVATYYLIATAEASSNLARYDGVRYGRRAEAARGLTDMYLRTRSEGFGAEVKRRILLGTYVLSAGYYDAYYRKAQQVRTLLRRDFETAFRSCDALVTPTSPEVAFALGSRTEDPLRMYLSDVFTVSANLAGLPGVSVPCGFSDGLPVGLQVLGPPLEEGRLLRIADTYQRRTAFHGQRPPEPV
ncbi:MAG: Asp-tRNA(Asn)/Glu-tRNA(Gln) amidotransferase subunit GatA [Myxococcota bacterium]|jgi:aspartyl-tRNA(Asn)/glutamyl-tRNA(Gln) amidotransferase subunit A|nr:Asp-tRNA(Asn)/Glu-tRNA(Gln) amidotransferase GatCAB subunit A [Deltaproteobacteria bacterium]MCP4239715.1 Asp-tRNA(Asn)/Glu-tRNA(Gln) amidotransferase subunit GatA [bacterium]MDP6074434.1 Asp-tRNA(Asn)/Glu-tRNA(Gln) amidotransferase subunit GatA [Myxococcota bacterium]MDP6244153.1 Asp-tRNA(Asn)/Glu-tRNA(Gln) amidotransferase subunit GatA [Myxococcota bacterium]MDP7073819.1 Asp-tRNA(Asn)/Glu-tRNA(Gln) amidotransferase subunit GatA [Myxococcota bacterium]